MRRGKKKLLFRGIGNRNKIIRIPVRKKHGDIFCCGAWHPRWNKPPGSAASQARPAGAIEAVLPTP